MLSRLPPLLAFVVACCGALLASPALAASSARVTDVRLWAGPEGTRLVLDLSAPPRYEVFTLDKPDRVVVDLANTELGLRKGLPNGQGLVKAVRSGPRANHGLRIVLDLAFPQVAKSYLVGPDGSAGHRLVVELPAAAEAAPLAQVADVRPAPQAPQAQQPRQTADGPSPVRTLASATTKGRDLVVAIDAGHGGQDPGAIGRNGTREKNVTLAIARKLAAQIDAEDGMRAVLIRDGDHFISLRRRSSKARELGADMFISVHADSVQNRGVSGSSVYVLSLKGASDEASRWLAERENAADLMGGVSLDDKSDVLASVLLDVTQKEAVSNSVEAADSVLAALRRIGTVHATRVKHAGFMVLKSPDIPSMLVETAFISNAADERRLRDTAHQQRIAQAIHAGVKNYFYEKPPPGTKIAALVAARRGGGSVDAQTLAER